MSARTSPDRAPAARPCVAVLDDRKLVRSGLQAALEASGEVVVVDLTELAPGGYVLLGQHSEAYAAPVGVRVVPLDVARSFEDTVAALRRGVASPRHSKRGRALSEREQVILSMSAAGSSATEIARRLGVSARTVERSRSAVTEKLAARSTSHAVAVGGTTRLTG